MPRWSAPHFAPVPVTAPIVSRLRWACSQLSLRAWQRAGANELEKAKAMLVATLLCLGLDACMDYGNSNGNSSLEAK